MRIAVTRLAGKEEGDEMRCRKYGHTCFSVTPLRAVIYHNRIQGFVQSVRRGIFDCVFFSSALPARLIAPHIARFSRLPRLIAIGPQTGEALAHHGIAAEVLPNHYSRELAPYLGDWVSGRRIGVPRADVPNPALREAIAQAGGWLSEVTCYALIPTHEVLDITTADAVLFTSTMSFREAFWKRSPEVIAMAIGEVTGAAMTSAGLPPAVIGNGTLEGVLSNLNKHPAILDTRPTGAGVPPVL
ncbi:MAG: uroporphyrinogen-III synthase [Methanomicrobiales archaeon]|nr:uroporphyrinogen-III synthase [Methanomicrobiales archaeon]